MFEYDDAIKIFNIIEENASLATYIILTGTYLQNNENEKAIELFNRMKNDNVSPDSQIYTFMIDLY
jgi:pentatricopeptide repeat protein